MSSCLRPVTAVGRPRSHRRLAADHVAHTAIDCQDEDTGESVGFGLRVVDALHVFDVRHELGYIDEVS